MADICPEKYLKKLTGNTEIEDALQELDRLTQEEARMASAELLKIAHSIDGNVMGVDDRVKGVDERVQEVGGDVQDVGKKVEDVDSRMQGIGGDVKDMSNKVQDVHEEMQGIHDKMQNVHDKVQGIDDNVHDVGNKVQVVDIKIDQANRLSSPNFPLRSGHPDTFTGNQLRDSLLRWLSPPDPSINHNIACKAHHHGSAQWFFRGSIFNQWKSTGSFLWLHGKRAFLHPFTARQFLIVRLRSGFGEEHTLVRPSSTYSLSSSSHHHSALR